MSAGETGGVDLTVETLHFIDDNWETVARTFDRAITDASTDPDTVWDRPALRNGDDKTLFDTDDIHGYDAVIRNQEVVTVRDGGRNDEAIGTEFDFDVTWEVDVTCESLVQGFNVVGDSTDWRVFVNIVRRALLTVRENPIIDPNGKYEWVWVTIINESTLPETEDNRDHFGTEFTAQWHGYEILP